ncbi:glycoside hydrolase family 5 [Pyrenophora seminiperda CCB06]|uniref:Glycoside hydrolase family 5 n=1 Tax=Pyrenophora seminiperda CCB06 TaxID=1302712 RepID=A0A3M7LWF6_9PLEO|nr:glycoside hydrolase family 5 [Pyrenophora seminiperda CCB06]
MKGFLQKAKAELKSFSQPENQHASSHPGNSQEQHQHHFPPPHHHGGSGQDQGSGPGQQQAISDPTTLDILRYRYHHGTNLGSVYVIERWLQPSRFLEGAQGSSELAAVRAWVDKIGIAGTKQKFEEHWANIVTDNAIGWLKNVAKCTTVRLPIGYYDLPNPVFTQGTPFEPYAEIYTGAWNSIRSLIQRLRAHSIGVLVDLHALPGGGNAQEHSGTNSGLAELWCSSMNRALGVSCCQFIAADTMEGAEIVGLQLVNEAEWKCERMYEWYDECIGAVSAIDPSLPIVISDGWDLAEAVDWSLQKNSVYPRSQCPVVVDTHYYWAFTKEDKAKTPQQIIQEAGTKLGQLDGKEGSVHDRGAIQVIVGEYSCVMTEDSWARGGGEPKEELVKQFGQEQSRRYQQRAGGSFFWTWKMDWMPGGEWGFKAKTEDGSIVPPVHMTLSADDRYKLAEKARQERDGRMHEAIQQHVSYWSGVDPHGHYEHEKYEQGWQIGYHDAAVFFQGKQTRGDKIGMLELWVLKRIKESGYRGGFTWLFEQGLRKGIQDYSAAVGVYRFTPPDTASDVPGEALPLLEKSVERKSYQVYCETAASSSRSSSCDSLIPSPLQIPRVSSLHIESDSPTPENHESGQNTIHFQAAASIPEPKADSVTLLKPGKDDKTQTRTANCDTLADSAVSHHITRAVTPRGSHSLASDKVTACDTILSHPRIQQMESVNCTTARTVLRKPIPHQGLHTGANYRQLPPLPLGEDSFKDEHSPGGDKYDEEDHEEGSRRVSFQMTTPIAGNLQDTHQIKQRSLPSPYDCGELNELRESIATGASHLSDSLKAPLRPYIRNQSSNLQQCVIYDRVRSIAAESLHIPRGNWSDIDDDAFIPSRRQPKHAISKNNYGKLPHQTADIPRSIPPQYDVHTQPAEYFTQPSSPVPSTDSSLDNPNGPRPPPWGSYDNLELQRRQRSEARGRTHTRGALLTANSALAYQKAHSTDSLGKKPVREVEEYREQILGMYPDIVFNGEAGIGGRGRCCCVLM